MKINNGYFVEKIANTKFIQKRLSKISDKQYDKLTNILPPAEALWATTLYCETIILSKNIPDERKPPLVWQSIIGGGSGVLFSMLANKSLNKYKDNICDELKKLGIEDGKKIIKGAKIAIPLIITSFIMRYLVSVASVPLSVKVANWYKKFKKDD